MIINPTLLNKILVFVIILFFIQITNDYSLDFNNLFKTSFSDGFSYLSIFENGVSGNKSLSDLMFVTNIFLLSPKCRNVFKSVMSFIL